MRIAEILRQRSLPSVEIELLLGHTLGRDRTWILAHDDTELTAIQLETFQKFLDRRQSHEPIAYILGRQEFYGREFEVNKATLVPRPATEGLVSTALSWLAAPCDRLVPIDTGIVALARTLRPAPVRRIADIGTGSGCIAITLALERPDLHLIATDVSALALATAGKNATAHGAQDCIEFREGSLLDPLLEITEPFLLVSNPPKTPSSQGPRGSMSCSHSWSKRATIQPVQASSLSARSRR